MKSYCSFSGVLFNSSVEESDPIFICDNPQLVIFKEENFKRVNLFTSKYEFLKRSPKAQPSMRNYVNDIFKELLFIFPNIEIIEYSPNDVNVVLSALFDKSDMNWEMEEWDTKFESKLVEKIFTLFVSHGWELMEKEGLWFANK